MPGLINRLAADVVVAMVSLAGSAVAQSAGQCTVGVNNYISYSVANKAGVPYSATVKETFEQKLADGNSIRGFTRIHEARDSSGKTMIEMASGCTRGEDGQPHERLRVTVYDPAAKTTMDWEVDGPKVARVFHRAGQSRPQMTPEESAKARAKASQGTRIEVHTEDLGTKMMNGVLAKGSQTVQTIPAGEEGNELAFEIVAESWHSEELGLTLLATRDDPRRGRTTAEFEELSLAEPDAALFAPPSGYAIEEIHQNVVVEAGVQ